MTYEVRLTTRAESDLEAAYLWYREHAPDYADQWYNGFLDALESLERDPESFSLIPERDAFGFDLRHLLYGGRHRWRVIFAIRNQTVLVLHLRHSARRPLGPNDLP